MTELILGVNIDHIATIRNARFEKYPDPVQAAFIAENAGADLITVHLREDRRHIIERDLYILRQTINTKMNLEISCDEEIVNIACSVKPDFCCLVPEKRKEITTEGGLNIICQLEKIKNVVNKLSQCGIKVSIFIEPDINQIDAAIESGVHYIELHTGMYSVAKLNEEKKIEFNRLHKAAIYAFKKGLHVHAGHGLHYNNVTDIARLKEITEINIGHAIISYAMIYGLHLAVENMKKIIQRARKK